MNSNLFKQITSIKRTGFGKDFYKYNGKQDITVNNYSEEFKKLLIKNYDSFKKCMESNVYDKAPKDPKRKLNLTSGNWVNSAFFHSFCHILFTIVEYFKIRSIYEIGTYMGGSTMLLLNYYNEKKIDNYKIDSIDIIKMFNINYFSKKTQIIYEKNKKNINLIINDSTKAKLGNKKYDLTIIDGSHRPNDVYLDFITVKDNSKYIYFDDLNLNNTYEMYYEKILKQKNIKEIFRVYTNDFTHKIKSKPLPNHHHCVSLIEILDFNIN